MREKKLFAKGIIVFLIGFTGISIMFLYYKNTGTDTGRQIVLFSKQVAEWSAEYLSSAYPFYVTVADLNQDGRLELITSTIQGTGKYSQNNYYIIEKGTSKIVQLEENTVGKLKSPDLIYDVMYEEKDVVMVPMYYDQGNDKYYFIYKDFCRVTPEQFTESIVSLTVDHTKIKEQYFAYKLLEYNMVDDAEWTVCYWDYDGNELSEAEYKTIEDSTYPDLEKKEMTWKWYKVMGNEIINMSQNEITDILKDLYDNFEIADIE